MRKIVLSGVAVVGLLAIGLAGPAGAAQHELAVATASGYANRMQSLLATQLGHAGAPRGLIVANAPDGADGVHRITLTWIEPPDPC